MATEISTEITQDVEVDPRVVRRTLKRIETRSVLRFAALFWLTSGLVLLMAGGILYFFLSTTGLVNSFQSTINNAGFPRFRLRAGTVFEILAVLMVAGAIAWTAVTVLAAFIFNLVAEASGGIEVTVRE